MKTFSGQLVVLVQSTKTPGPIELQVSGKNVRKGKGLLQSKNGKFYLLQQEKGIRCKGQPGYIWPESVHSYCKAL